MHFIAKKGSSKTMYLFILTGLFLVILSSYDLYNYLQTNPFVSKFPGDWDKIIGIAVGLFLIIRSKKFIPQSKGLFVKVARNHLVYRIKDSDPVHKITLSAILKIKRIDEYKVKIISKDLTEITLDFRSLVWEKNRKAVIKSIVELNPYLM